MTQWIIDTWNALADVTVAGNTGRQIMGAMVLFVVLLVAQWAAVQITTRAGRGIARRTRTDADDTMVALVSSIRMPFFVTLALYLSLRLLTLPDAVRKALGVIFLIAFAVQGIRIVERLIVYLVEHIWLRRNDKKEEIISPIRIVLRLLLGLMAVLLVLSNIGINVTSLVAGLGIGGVAIGFALQEVLSDVFNSFSIYVDKPFRPGDFIVVRNYMGTVQRVTFNSTRIQSLQGEEIVVPNKDIANEWVQNFKHMRTRRVAFGFGVTYETPLALLRDIPSVVEKVMKPVKLCRFERAHFKAFGDSSLDYEVVYYVDSSEYLDYMNIQQEINLRIVEEFAARGISMAYPTRTLHMAAAKEEKRSAATTKSGAKTQKAAKRR